MERGKGNIGKDSLIHVLLLSVVLVKARAMGSAGNRLLLPSPSHRGSVSADRKIGGEEFGEAPKHPKRGAGGARAGLTLGMSPGAAAGPSLLPHTRDTAGVTSKKTRDIEVTTQVPPSPTQQELLQAAHKHLGCAEGEHQALPFPPVLPSCPAGPEAGWSSS